MTITGNMIENLQARKVKARQNFDRAMDNYSISADVPPLPDFIPTEVKASLLPEKAMRQVMDLNLGAFVYAEPAPGSIASEKRFAVANVKSAVAFAHSPMEKNAADTLAINS